MHFALYKFLHMPSNYFLNNQLSYVIPDKATQKDKPPQVAKDLKDPAVHWRWYFQIYEYGFAVTKQRESHFYLRPACSLFSCQIVRFRAGFASGLDLLKPGTSFTLTALSWTSKVLLLKVLCKHTHSLTALVFFECKITSQLAHHSLSIL